jgi:drug/metabolite transporter (DMT)-like permease
VTHNLARLQVLAAAILFSTSGAGIKAAAFSAPQVTAFRSGIAAIALLLWLRGRMVWSLPAIGIGVVYAATVTLFVASTKLTTAANAIFLQATAPLYLLVLAPLVLGERFRARDLVYMCALAVGMTLCFVGQAAPTLTAPDPAKGNLLGVLCSMTWAVTLLSLRFVERNPTRPGVGITAVVAGNVLACLITLPSALPFPHASAIEWGTIAYLGVFQLGLGYLCLTAAVRHLHALDVSLLLLLEPVLNPVWTWLLRGEHPGRWALMGGSVIVAATALKGFADSRTEGRTNGTNGSHLSQRDPK